VGRLLACAASLSWKGIIFSPEQSRRNGQRASGLVRHLRKAESNPSPTEARSSFYSWSAYGVSCLLYRRIRIRLSALICAIRAIFCLRPCGSRENMRAIDGRLCRRFRNSKNGTLSGPMKTNRPRWRAARRSASCAFAGHATPSRNRTPARAQSVARSLDDAIEVTTYIPGVAQLQSHSIVLVRGAALRICRECATTSTRNADARGREKPQAGTIDS